MKRKTKKRAAKKLLKGRAARLYADAVGYCLAASGVVKKCRGKAASCTRPYVKKCKAAGRRAVAQAKTVKRTRRRSRGPHRALTTWD